MFVSTEGQARALGFALVLALGFALGLAGVVPASAQQPIRIGLQGPITGPWALEGEMAVNSVRIVVDQINARGGILGRPVELVIGDDQGEVRQSALTAQRMVAEGVVAVISSYGSRSEEHTSELQSR